jgi:Leucine-rich repeat (LRR) protein
MLEELDISKNALSSLAKLENLPNLRYLNISDNNVNSIGPEVMNMMSLDTLVMSGNPVVRMHPQLT